MLKRLYIIVLLACDLNHVNGDEDPKAPLTDDSSSSDQVRFSYGVDVSWPMHHEEFVENSPLPSQQKVYKDFMQGCYDAYDEESCDTYEKERIEMTLNQPSYQRNYTSAGYAKVPAPPKAFAILRKVWNGKQQFRSVESWDAGNVYTNHWESETEILDLDEREVGFTPSERKVVAEEIQAVLERWVGGVPLVPTSLYGIRVYNHGSILSHHVDRLPLVVSAIVNIARDNVYEGEERPDWVLELIGHDGVAVNVTMEPGELLLYESASIIHGRPYALEGNFYANAFVHFEPVGYSAGVIKQDQRGGGGGGGITTKTAKQLYEERFARQQHQREEKNGGETRKHPPTTQPRLPPYIQEGTREASMWLQEYVFYRQEKKSQSQKVIKTSGVTDAHILAASGSLQALKDAAVTDPQILHRPDSNGWRPLHEAARSGATDVVEYLIKNGANVNLRTNLGLGGTPLWWAEHMLYDNHPVILLLKEHGAVSIAPGEPAGTTKESSKKDA